MTVDKHELLVFLETVDNQLQRPLVIVAVGGTAMTLLGIKPSTIDMDFDVTAADFPALKKALAAVPHGYRIDVFTGGLIFSQQLPEDYLQKTIPVASFRNIQVRALRPLDIIVTKIGRLNQRDEEDIKDCIRRFAITKTQILRRAEKIIYIGKEELYKDNLRYVCSRFYP